MGTWRDINLASCLLFCGVFSLVVLNIFLAGIVKLIIMKVLSPIIQLNLT